MRKNIFVFFFFHFDTQKRKYWKPNKRYNRSQYKMSTGNHSKMRQNRVCVRLCVRHCNQLHSHPEQKTQKQFVCCILLLLQRLLAFVRYMSVCARIERSRLLYIDKIVFYFSVCLPMTKHHRFMLHIRNVSAVRFVLRFFSNRAMFCAHFLFRFSPIWFIVSVHRWISTMHSFSIRLLVVRCVWWCI